ncbi:uncharacterized protein LOC122049117 [Zingiber officinale]|uniref:PAR1 protein n=1 Tax=Zingiber officinale TaxID=94328 RepID=A0A8J5LD76_ZINOF|nr:uncharacterized protein LOC122049117 [Zingiber officinale]KAG6523993.1 hypothetical protein ZIOFF_013882 [Zingiber officinale]
MASPAVAMASALILLSQFQVLFPAALGGVVCEKLPQDLCAFAISSESKRCVLESSQRADGETTEYQCRTSEVEVEVEVGRRMKDWIETDGCVSACGVSRDAVGISSDALVEPDFVAKLCSASCYQNCPNIVDLYLNLCAGEGVFLPDLCEVQKVNPRRAMAELLSSGAAPGFAASAPAPAPSSSP